MSEFCSIGLLITESHARHLHVYFFLKQLLVNHTLFQETRTFENKKKKEHCVGIPERQKKMKACKKPGANSPMSLLELHKLLGTSLAIAERII